MSMVLKDLVGVDSPEVTESATKHQALSSAIEDTSVRLMDVYDEAMLLILGSEHQLDPKVGKAIKAAIVGTVKVLEEGGGINLRYTHQGDTHLTVMDGLGASFEKHFAEVNS